MVKGRILPLEEIRAIFERFAEGNPYYIPLLLGYYCGFNVEEAFALTFECVQPGRVYKKFAVKYNRDNCVLYFKKACEQGYVEAPSMVEKPLRRAINRNLCAAPTNYRPVYYIDKKGCLNVKSGIPISLVNLRSDGSFVSPLGINHVARVIHGKKGNFRYPDSEWKFEDMIESGKYYERSRKKLVLI